MNHMEMNQIGSTLLKWGFQGKARNHKTEHQDVATSLDENYVMYVGLSKWWHHPFYYVINISLTQLIFTIQVVSQTTTICFL